ncbi:MAG: prepilin-type N-terminal cleavage/methylation domain-containing protein [Lachnospiraceae bacterium]
MNNLKEKKLDNKGFSLVELIIVIAIMAVLIGVLAPQYLKYVEKSRQSADLDTIDSMVNAVTIYSADPANSIVSDHLKCASGTVSADPQVRAALTDAGVASTLPKMKSKAYQDWDIEFSETGMTFTGTNGAALKAAMGY